MEIISYIGFETDKKNFRFYLDKLSHILKKKNKSYYLNRSDLDYAKREASVKNVYSFKNFLIDLGRLISFVQENIKSVLISLLIILVALSLIISSVLIVNRSKNFTGPLTIDYNSEVKVLNDLMSSFVLDEKQEFLEDGTLVDLNNSLNAKNLFYQPVTYQNYVVKSGDTISGITKKFGLRNISTLIAVNDIDNVRQLAQGQKIKIPSIDGLVYTVKQGNSLQGIASKFNIPVEDLLDVNELESEKLFVGQTLFIPGAKMDSESLKKALGELFICPITDKFKISSHYGKRADPFTGVASSHTGVDLACPQGTPIRAAMSGQVLKVGTSRIFGNYIIITHNGGYQTLYAHLHKILCKKGTWVSQGTKIGLVGSTGYSTGPHLHFSAYKYGKLINPEPLIFKK